MINPEVIFTLIQKWDHFDLLLLNANLDQGQSFNTWRGQTTDIFLPGYFAPVMTVTVYERWQRPDQPKFSTLCCSQAHESVTEGGPVREQGTNILNPNVWISELLWLTDANSCIQLYDVITCCQRARYIHCTFTCSLSYGLVWTYDPLFFFLMT